MAYNFTPYKPRESNVEPGSLGIKIVSLLMQGQNMKQDNALKVDAAKQQALDRVTEQQYQQRAVELAQSFPTDSPPPSSYDEAVTGFGRTANVYQAQNKWLGQNAGRLASYGKTGSQVFGHLQQVADNTRMLELGTEMRSLADKEATRRIDITRRFGAFTPDNEALYNTDQSIAEIDKDFSKENLIYKEVPAGVINDRGFINRQALIKWKGQLREDQAALGNVPNTGYEYDIKRMVVLKPKVAQLEEALRNAQTQEEDTAIRSQLNPLREELNLREQRQTQKNDSPVLSGLSPEMRALLMAKQKEIVESSSKNKHAELKSLYESFGQTYDVRDFSSPIPDPASATSTNRTSSGVKWSVQP